MGKLFSWKTLAILSAFPLLFCFLEGKTCLDMLRINGLYIVMFIALLVFFRSITYSLTAATKNMQRTSDAVLGIFSAYYLFMRQPDLLGFLFRNMPSSIRIDFYFSLLTFWGIHALGFTLFTWKEENLNWRKIIPSYARIWGVSFALLLYLNMVIPFLEVLFQKNV